MSTTDATARRDWNWDSGGTLDGLYVETRQVTPKSGPSAGTTKLVFDFRVGPDDELVTVWENTVLRSRFGQELVRRGKDDFEPGERITVTPLGWKDGARDRYRDFDITFEFAAPKPSAAELLAADTGEPDREPGPPQPKQSDDIPF
jgi:hypothetical protein